VNIAGGSPKARNSGIRKGAGIVCANSAEDILVCGALGHRHDDSPHH